MRYVALRKVPYRLPGTKRLVWAVILAESEGLTLLFVRKPDENHSHTLAIGMENMPERVFETVNASQFHVQHEDMAEIGSKLQALAERLSSEEFTRRFFRADDSWWKECFVAPGTATLKSVLPITGHD
jgi:hypothetical protein